MNTTKNIVMVCLILLFITMIGHCTINVFAAESTDEAFEIPGECAKRADKCNVARVVEEISALEKAVLGEHGAAIWYFDGSKYPAKKDTP